MLAIRNLSKTYDNGIQALKDVSLEIGRGMFGLLGPNGAGKSTLMRTIATLQEADRGTVTLNGLDILRQKEEVRRILGYLPQEYGLYPQVTAEAMLDHLSVLKGIRGAGARREAVHGLLQLTDLWEVRRQRLGTFSGGMRQRFGIAQALLGDPELIIVDEPTAGLDPEGRQRFLNLLSRIGEDVVVILSTHIVADVSELCTHMAIIHEGQVRLTGEPAAALDGLRGKIWQKVVGRDEGSSAGDCRAVISTRLLAGRMAIRAVSDADPGDGFEPAEPDLEDVYFSTLKAVG